MPRQSRFSTSRSFFAIPILLLALAASACGGSDDRPSQTCGNGVREGSEQCDDGNTTAGDGCSATCRNETSNPDATVTEPDSGTTTNPDATVTEPDSGTTTPDSGTTTPDSGTVTPDAGTPDSGPAAACGNGTVETGEECDDGNTASDDGCSATCHTERCGDGVAQANEECDDGNTASDDGCSATCHTERCGDGVIQSSEQCEGADLNNATCASIGFVGGTLSCGATCAFDASLCFGPGCGNGVLEAGEQCDDGNTGDNDGCSATCQTEACGDGITQANEQCDDANQVNTDACKNDCTLPACGDALVSAGEQCDDGNVADGDGCDHNCTATACGNGVVTAGEQCDDGNTVDGDGCSAACQSEICGDGVVQAGEQCDDGNTTNGDCCSASCHVEAGCEIEANDTTGTANDFATTALANVLWGHISPANDVDYFRVTVPAGVTGTIVAETQDAFDGTTCASNAIDSAITLFDAAGTQLAENDDTASSYCSRVELGSLAAGDYYVEVAASPFASVGTFAYNLHVTLATAACGNGVVEAGEQCDDGNTTSGDGCSATCQSEGVAEVEPNGDAATATPITPGLPVSGAIDPAGDRDYYAVTLATYTDLRVELFDSTGVTCASIDTYVDLLAPDGTTVLVGDDDDGIGLCSLVNPTTDAAARHLAPGTYYIRARAYSATAVIAAYRMAVTLVASCGNGAVEGSEQCDGTANCGADCMRIPTCGDTFIDGAEQCDDGNTTNGDGCSSTCQREQVCGNGFIESGEDCDDGNTTAGDGCDASCRVEAGHFWEIGDNGSTATANGPFTAGTVVHGAITPVGDQDYYAITITAPTDLRLETFDANPARNSCTGLDTVIRFYDSTGTQITSDDEGGIGSCSLLDPTTTAAMRRLAPGTYYVRVEDYLNDGTIAGYQLAVTFVAVCGDNVVAGSEQCDDGNLVDDATCNSNCTLPACGDGRVGNTPGEVCDDGNTTSGDGCDANCTVTACGNGVVTTGEQCDDGNLANGDGCSSTCVLEIPCGNGILDAGEQCDDGNTTNGDGCSYPACQTEAGHFYEVEPNDDGTPSNAADFDAARANGPFTSTVIIHATINPVGDDDFYAVSNPSAAPRAIRVDAYNAAPGYGLGVACGTSIDTYMQIFNAAGSALATNDDRNGSSDYCSGLDYTVAAGDTIYVRLIRYGDATAIPSPGYLLRIAIPVCGNGVVENGEECEPAGTATCDATCQRVPICGDGFIDAPEQCDDSNTVNGDGCSSTCQTEGVETEVEPNDTTANADVAPVQIDRSVKIIGTLVAPDIQDYYRVNIAGPETVRFEVYDNAGVTDCASTTTTQLRLYDSAGTQIITDTTSGIRSCSMMTFPFSTAGTYYIRVEEAGQNANIANYMLEVTFMTNTGAEVEPNDTQATANLLTGNNVFISGDHAVNADADWYQITLATAASLRLEVIEGDRAVETCEGLGVDSRVTLYNGAGTQLVDDDDDSRGFCSMIDGTGTTPLDSGAHNLAAGTYYAQVRASSFSSTGAAGQFIYKLIVTSRTP